MNYREPAALRAPGPFSMGFRPHGVPVKAATPPPPLAAVDDVLTQLVAALTPRRFEVLQFVARGLTNREIASVMKISANTVKAHLTGVLETLDLTNRTEAAIALQAYEAQHPEAARP